MRKTRRLSIEPLENRELLAVTITAPDPGIFAPYLAAVTPNPHPTGDQPLDASQMITLSAYTPPPPIPNPFPAYAEGLQAIYTNILNNPQARPSFWGENADATGDLYRVHFDDNGMLIQDFIVNWGDGSTPQGFSNQAWAVHQYAGSSANYTITVTAWSYDGTYSSGTGDTPGQLDPGFNPISGGTTNSMGHNPNWIIQSGPIGQQVTNFEGNSGFDQGSAVTLDNGNILMAGTTAEGQFGLVRYIVDPGQSDDGNPDTTFGDSGMVTTSFTDGPAQATAVAVNATSGYIVVGGIVVASNGDDEIALARYNEADGSLDTTFGNGGMVTTDLGSGWTSTDAIAFQGTSILVAGSYDGHFGIVRYTSTGVQQTTFGSAPGGIVTINFGGTDETPCAITVTGSGSSMRILVAGTSTQPDTGEDFALARLKTTGKLDTAFGSGGMTTTDFAGYNDVATAMTVDSSGNIVLAGSSDDGTGNISFALARYTSTGWLDSSFGNGGLVTDSFGDGADYATGVAIDSAGRIVVSGTSYVDGNGNTDTVSHFALLRFNSDGSLDTTFGSGTEVGAVTTDFSDLGFTTESSCGIMVDSTGRLIVAGTATQSGYSSFAVACYDPGLATLSVQVQYDPPVLRIVVPSQAVEAGQTLNLPTLGMFANAYTTDSFTYQIDWGDGNVSNPEPVTILNQGSGSELMTGSFGGSHTYTTAGTYYVAATVTDAANGDSDTQTFQVTVDSGLAFQTAVTAPATVDAGQTYTLPAINFTGAGTHTATINWGDGTTDTSNDLVDLTEPSFNSSQLVAVPGSISDSHAYSASGTYGVTITISDDSGTTISEPFTVQVLNSAVTLNDFSTDGRSLDVTYTITGATSAPFHIGIYSSPDGSTPDQSLASYEVGGINSGELTVGQHTVSIAPPAADISGNYYLIATADEFTTSNTTAVFDGGVFQGDGTVYVFGTGGNDTVNVSTSSVTLDGTPYLLTTTPTAIHIRTEGGGNTVNVAPGVTTPEWIYGGDSGGNIITDDGSSGQDIIDAGNGPNNQIHSGYGFNSPEIVDDSDPQTAASGATAYYTKPSGFTAESSGFNGGEEEITSGTATWTFTGLTAGDYYDVYVTWSPTPSASGAAVYKVNGVSQAAVNQTLSPVDDQADGAFWHDLGVFQASSATLTVQLGTGDALADAVRLVAEGTTAPATSLTVGGFSISPQGEISVTYTVGGSAAAAPFTIGIYGAPDGRTPTDLLQTIDVTDSSQLAPGTYTATADAALSGIPETDYLLAELDINDQVYETSRAQNISAPWSGIFEQDDGTLYVVGSKTYLANDQITLTQDASSGNITVNVTDNYYNPVTAQAFSGVSAVTVSTPGGGDTITIDPSVTVPVSVYDGSQSTVSGTPDNWPDVAVEADKPTVSESGGQTGEFTFYCPDEDATGQLTVYFTVSGNANYAINGATQQGYNEYYVTIPDNDTQSATVQIVPNDTGAVSGSETMALTLETGSGYNVDSDDNAAAVTIYNNDLPTVSITTTESQVNESGGGCEFVLTTSGAISEPLMVNYTIGDPSANGVSYQTLSGSVVIPANSTTATIALNPFDLGLTSGSQTVTLTLGSGRGYTVSQSPNNFATVTIEDNDSGPPSQELIENDVPLIAQYTPIAVQTVDLSSYHAVAKLVVTNWDPAGLHYDNISYKTPGGQQVNIDFSDLSVGTVVTTQYPDAIFNGGTVESDGDQFPHVYMSPGGWGGTFEIDFTQPVEDLSFSTGWVDTSPPHQFATAAVFTEPPVPTLVVSNPIAVEGDSETFTVTLTQAVNTTVTVSYQTVAGSAAAGTDYTAQSGTLTFSANQTSQTVTVPTQLDGTATSDLGFSLALGTPQASGVTINGGGASGTATVQIVTGSITIYNSDGTASSDGMVYDGDWVPMTVRLTSPTVVTGQFMLDYDTHYFKITTDAAGNNVVTPDATTFTASTGGTQLYLWGEGSTAASGSQIKLEYVEGDPSVIPIAAALCAAAPLPKAKVTYAPTPSGTFTITTGTVTIKDPAQQIYLGKFNWGYTITYAAASPLPKGVTMPAGSTIVLVQALNSDGIMTGNSAHFDADKVTVTDYFQHQQLPPYGPPLVDRQYNPRTKFLGANGHYWTITVAADAQITGPNGGCSDYILGCVTLTLYDELTKASLTVNSVTPKVTVTEPTVKTITAAAVAADSEWTKALDAWMDWKPGDPN